MAVFGTRRCDSPECLYQLRFDAGDRRELANQKLDRMLQTVEQIDPLASREFVGEGLVGRDLLDPDRDYDEAALSREHQLFLDVFRIIVFFENNSTMTLAARIARTIGTWKFSSGPTS